MAYFCYWFWLRIINGMLLDDNSHYVYCRANHLVHPTTLLLFQWWPSFPQQSSKRFQRLITIHHNHKHSGLCSSASPSHTLRAFITFRIGFRDDTEINRLLFPVTMAYLRVWTSFPYHRNLDAPSTILLSSSSRTKPVLRKEPRNRSILAFCDRR